MSTDVAYLDTSAFVKLLVEEPESGALRMSLSTWQRFALSVILRTETLRALRRSGHADLVGAARGLFATMHLIALDISVLDRAGEMAPRRPAVTRRNPRRVVASARCRPW